MAASKSTLLVALLLLTDAAYSSGTLRTVAVRPSSSGSISGQLHPSFDAPRLNNSGHVVFLAETQGTSGGGYSAWTDSSGTLTRIAGRGDLAPSTAEGTEIDFFTERFAFNDLGQTLLRAGTSGNISNGGTLFATYLAESGEIDLVVKRGDPAPGSPSGVYLDVLASPLLINNSGRIAFREQLNIGFPFSHGIYVVDDAIIQYVARVGAPAPGTAANFSNLNEPVLNNSGHVAFSGNNAVWYGTPGNISQVAGAGQAIPGALSDEEYSSIQSPVINNVGEVAFRSAITGTNVTTANDIAIWVGLPGNISMRVRKGETVLGTTDEIYFAGLNLPVINDNSKIAFSGLMTGTEVSVTNDSGLWSDGLGSMQLIAREDDAPPGVIDGSVFGTFANNSYTLNSLGQVAFTNILTGTNVTTANDKGIWVTDTEGTLHLVAREGDTLEVAPGDVRTISELRFISGTGNSDGRPSAFNDLGQLAFSARFTDNSGGVFVSNLVADFGDLPGDYNKGNTVNAADYVRWRDGLSAPYTPNDPDDYGMWMQNFGGSTSESADSAAVPEPSAVILVLALLLSIAIRRSTVPWAVHTV